MDADELGATIIKWLIGVAIAVVIFCAIGFQFAHKLENQDLAIVQAWSGQVEVRKDAGWWMQVSPTITKYPKAGMYRLNAQDKDSLEIQFNNKSKALMNAAIGYRIDNADDATLIALHQQVEGNDDKIWQMVLTALNTAAQSISTKYDPSSVIGGEKFEPMVREIYTAIMHNPELLKHGIDVNYFAVDGRPVPDKDTEDQFNKQKEADLAKRLAEAEKVKLEAETLKTEAQYQREIAEFKGKADAETAKLKTEAEREKELATIAAQKQVEVAKLEKERAVIEIERQKEVAKVEAEKLREVAEIQKQTEAANLEAIKLQAEQKIASAQAKKQEIELSGAITELQRMQLEVDMKTKIGVAEAYAKGIAGAKLPQMWVTGGNNANGAASNPIEMLIQTMTLEKLDKLGEPVTAPKPAAPAKTAK